MLTRPEVFTVLSTFNEHMSFSSTVATFVRLYLLVCSLAGISKLSDMRRRKQENQAILQLMLIVGAFLIAYIPTTGKLQRFLT